MIAKSVEDLIGDTPLIRLNRVSKLSGANIYGKCEFLNPTSSVKDRIAVSMIDEALRSGRITKDTVIIEPTSGNTGVALASICASRGLKLILTMPESMSIERQKLLKFLGAEIVLTPAELAMDGAIAKAMELKRELGGFVLQQFENPSNPKAHLETAREILADLREIDYFVAGVGTGGTLTGVGEVLKESICDIKIVAVEPKGSAVLSGGERGVHNIQGIGGGLIPKVLDVSLYGEIIKVDDKSAYDMARDLARYEGLLVGISSGANVYSAFEIAKRAENRGKTIVTILCDTAERYLTTELFS
ncbi:MAG: cysteine synthase A [Epsilonproteobacteria bacterium]|nr:cysteine synthase A [Campylobacterota bacterium]